MRFPHSPPRFTPYFYCSCQSYFDYLCRWVAQSPLHPSSNTDNLILLERHKDTSFREMSNSTSYGPDEDEKTIVTERYFLAGDLLAGVGYGTLSMIHPSDPIILIKTHV